MRHLGLLPSGRQLDLAHRALTALAGLMLGLVTPFWIVPRLVEMSPRPFPVDPPPPAEETAGPRMRLTIPGALGTIARGPGVEAPEVSAGVSETALAIPEMRIFGREHSDGIFFNHASHIFRHFGEGPGAVGCASCHTAGEKGEPVASPTFERACASCHSGEMEKVRREAAGLLVFSLPAIDLKAVSDLRLQIGAWPDLGPAAAGRITGMMDLLLAIEPGYAEDRARLEGLDLTNLSSAKPEQMVALERAVWAIKRMYRDLLAGGAECFLARLEQVIGEPVSEPSRRVLVQRYPGAELRAMIDRHLPGLRAEVEASFGKDPWKGGELPPDLPALAVRSMAVTEVKSPGLAYGWYRTGATLAYRAIVHADPVQRALIDLSGSLPTENGQKVYSELMEGTFCTRCHQLEVAGGRFKRLRWQPHRTQSPGPLAHFSHRSHTGGEGAPGCAACHSVDLGKSADDLARKAERPSSDFLAVHRTECIACHRSLVMADDCKSCHTSYGPPVLNTVQVQRFAAERSE